MECDFSFRHLEEIFKTAIEHEYFIIPCYQYPIYKDAPFKLLINRVDIDFDCPGAMKIAKMFNRLEIKGTFFIRLHAEEYNPFSIKNHECLKYIKNTGHEIGLHTEMLDFRSESSPELLLHLDIEVLNKMFGIQIVGSSSHRGERSNLDFWKDNNPASFGLEYEAYGDMFEDSVYVADSLYICWKCYRNGILDEGDHRCLCEHIKDGNKLLYTLIHPVTYKE